MERTLRALTPKPGQSPPRSDPFHPLVVSLLGFHSAKLRHVNSSVAETLTTKRCDCPRLCMCWKKTKTTQAQRLYGTRGLQPERDGRVRCMEMRESQSTPPNHARACVKLGRFVEPPFSFPVLLQHA